MRKRVTENGIRVQAVAGNYVVLLGWSIEDGMRAGLRGFAVRRSDPTEGESYWMKGTKVFASVEPYPAPGEQFSSLRHPFQTFQWADYSAKPGRPYTYEIVALYGPPDALEQRAAVSVKVVTEPVSGVDHTVVFNRGSPATQEYARRFQNRPPRVAGEGAYRWLSRGLLEAITGFVARAEGPGWSLDGAFYEFQWPAVLDALAAARGRGATLRIVFDAIDKTDKNGKQRGPRDKNIDAIEHAGLEDVCIRRTNGTLMHNKFLVLSHNGVPQALLFGSTNITENGIFGHANCVHIVEGADPAAAYLAYVDRLEQDPETTLAAGYRQANEAASPAPFDLAADPLGPVYSPRTGLAALEWYAKLAGGAKKGLFMTFAFGMHRDFAAVFGQTDGKLRMALMEKEWNGANKEAQIARVRAVQALPNVVIAVGNRIPLSGFDQWLAELDRVTKEVNVHWVHTKFMLVDPLSNDPLVVTGSANFSEASTQANDENMLAIRGVTRVADIYLGEFFRLHSHYAFRQAVAIFLERNPGAGPEDFERRFLDETPGHDWTADYFTPGDRNARTARRLYFAGL